MSEREQISEETENVIRDVAELEETVPGSERHEQRFMNMAAEIQQMAMNPDVSENEALKKLEQLSAEITAIKKKQSDKTWH